MLTRSLAKVARPFDECCTSFQLGELVGVRLGVGSRGFFPGRFEARIHTDGVARFTWSLGALTRKASGLVCTCVAEALVRDLAEGIREADCGPRTFAEPCEPIYRLEVEGGRRGVSAIFVPERKLRQSPRMAGAVEEIRSIARSLQPSPRERRGGRQGLLSPAGWAG